MVHSKAGFQYRWGDEGMERWGDWEIGEIGRLGAVHLRVNKPQINADKRR